MIEIFRELDEGKLLDKVVLAGEVGHTTRGCASVHDNGVPVNEPQKLLIVEELGRQLELKDSLAATLAARGHIGNFVTFADPEGTPNIALLLRVAKDLARILRGDDIEKFVLCADLRVVLMVRVDELLQDFDLPVVFPFLFDACIFILTASSILLAGALLVGLQKSFRLLVIDLTVFAFVEVLTHECKL